MTSIVFTNPYPADYFDLMDKFCEKEFSDLMNTKFSSFSEDRRLLRKKLLEKRDQFNYEKFKKGLLIKK